jgi:hypothetical protein
MAENPESTTSARRITGIAREQQAVQLRSNGASYDQIADALGYSQRDAAYKAVVRGIRRYAEHYPESIELARSMALQRIDQMMLAVWPDARRGDVQAIDRVLRLETRRASLLGLDAPKTFEARVQLDVAAWNQAIRDILAIYQEFHDETESTRAFLERVDALAEEKFADVK